MTGSKHGKEKEPRHVRLYHWLMKTEAWRDLSPVQRCAYLELAARYGGPGSNNGMIPYSMAELVDALHISKSTAHAALKALQDHGFIVLTRQGGFNIKHRHAAEWLLTEFKDDRPNKGLALPSKDFARWKKSEHGSARVPHRVRSPNRTGTPAEQSLKGTMAYGSATVPDQPNDGSARVPLLVYQGQDAASTTTEAVQAVAEEAPVHTGRARRSDRPAAGFVQDTPARATGPVHVSDVLKGMMAQPAHPPKPLCLGDDERSLLRWLQGFDGTASHRTAQQNLSGILKGDAIAEAAKALSDHGLAAIEEKGRSRIYTLLDPGRDPGLINDPNQFDLVNWLEGAVQ